MNNDVLSTEFYSMDEVGLLRVEGADSLDFLHRLSTQTFEEFGAGTSIVSTVFPTSQGKMVDWAWVIRGDDCLWVRTAAGRAGALKEWLDKFIIMEDVLLVEQSSAYRGCSIQAANSHLLLGGEVERTQVCSAHGGYWYNGLSAYGNRLEGWFAVEELSAVAAKLKDAEWKEALPHEVEACRIAAGIPSSCWEYKQEISPLELRLMNEAIAWNKGCYIGQEVISRLDSYDKVKRLLMGFSTTAALPTNESIRVRKDGKSLGSVTSFVRLKNGTTMGLAIIERHSLEPLEVDLTVGEQCFSAILEDRPFWKGKEANEGGGE